MRYKEIIEGIRMGAKDLAVAAAKQYTIGFEFEVAVDGDFDNDDRYEIDSDDVAVEDDWDGFYDWWYSGNSTFDFEDWLNSNIIRDNRQLLDLIESNDIVPRNPATDEDVVRFLNKEKFSKISKIKQLTGEEKFNNVIKLLDEYENDIDQFVENTNNVYKMAVYYHVFIKDYNESEITDRIQEKVEELFDNDEYEKIEKLVHGYYARLKDNFVGEEITEYDLDDTTIYFFDDNGVDILDLDEIRDIDDLTAYFDVSRGDLQDFTQEQWMEAESEEMNYAFNDWSQSHGIKSRNSKIRYVTAVINDEFDTRASNAGSSKNSWAVIPDGTAGVDAEITSPAMPLDQGIQALSRVLELIKDNPSLRTSRATGLHINIGTFTQQEADNVDWLKFLMIMNAERVLQQFDRIHNTYAPDKLPDIISSLQNNDLNNYMNDVQSINDIVKRLSQKYSAVNLSKLAQYGIIELRAPGNAGYETQAAYLEQTVKRIVRALELASDPNKYKKEYLSMLAKRFTKVRPNNQLQPRLNLDSYFEKTYGFRFSIFDFLNSVVLSIARIDDIGGKPDKGYTLEIHQELLRKLRTYLYSNSAAETHEKILEALEKYDKQGVMRSSKMISLLLKTLEKTAQQSTAQQ